ncbi:MAG: hypothetical protein QXO44_00735 [Thermoplasmatales archaeon]
MAEELLFPSKEWIEEYCRRLSESSDYNKSGKGWKDPIMFKISDPETLKGRSDFDSFILNLKDGKCEGIEIVKDANSSFIFELEEDNRRKDKPDTGNADWANKGKREHGSAPEVCFSSNCHGKSSSVNSN